MTTPSSFALACPLPLDQYPHVLLAHGGGGKLMNQLIEKMFFPAFGPSAPGLRHDSAVLQMSGAKLAFTTDSFVVRPLFFPGGDIGALAVYGTVNDLAMSGATAALSQRRLCAGRGPADGDALARRPIHGARLPLRRACGSSPATPRWWTGAKATAFLSIPPASASSNTLRPSPGDRSNRATPCC